MVKGLKKRGKNSVAAAEKENNKKRVANDAQSVGQTSMEFIFSKAQINEAFHKRYVKELKQLYTELEHCAFLYIFIGILKTVLEAEENNEYGTISLSFCAKFVTSFESEKTHPLLAAIFQWLLTTISPSPHIRYRLCYFVNLILKELGPYAALDDTQCDQILYYMLARLSDTSVSVRKQAVLAMQRLQVPDNPEDAVVCAYQYHMASDPSPNVRQCVITCMGRNYQTIPFILKRLWDVDEKTRRHTYLNLCNYPVRSYKVSQRLTILEQGLNDSSESVRKAVIKFMLKQWIESYQNSLISLTAALKLDTNEEEVVRFRRIARQMLMVIFEQNDNQEILAQLPLSENCELHRCVPQDELTVETVLYWQCLSAYFQQNQADEFELVLPELSVFCVYVKKFCELQKPDMEQFAQVEFQTMLLSLVEILHAYDLGDEIGRNNLRELIIHLLENCLLDHKTVAVLIRSMEELETNTNTRLHIFIEIIYKICELNTKQNDLVHDRNLNHKLLDELDTSLRMKVSSLKVKILELEEQEENFVRQKEYMRAQTVNDEKNSQTEKYTELIRPLLEKHGVFELPSRPKMSRKERVLKGLYITFYMVATEKVESLNPSICNLYKDFVCRHLASTEADILEWSIKCSSIFSLLYESYAKEVFEVAAEQLYKDTAFSLYETSATCVFELLDHYGLEYFSSLSQVELPNKSRRRQLYTVKDFNEGDDDASRNSSLNVELQNLDIISFMCMFVERVMDKGIGLATVKGLCRMVLRGQLNDRPDVLERLLKRYFNPNTEPKISQVLGLFFENLLALKLQHILEPCLLPVLWNIVNCKYDSPLSNVIPDNVTKFFIDMTVLEPSTPQTNIHNKIAISFLHYLQDYYTDRKDMCRLLAKELTTLQLNVIDSPQMKKDMHELADKLIKSDLEPRVIRNIINFKNLVDGSFNPPLRKPDGNESDEECDSATVTTTSEYQQTPAIEEEETLTNRAASETSNQTQQEGSSTYVENRNEDTLKNARNNPHEESNEIPQTTRKVTSRLKVSVRNLRRSMQKSICMSDSEVSSQAAEEKSPKQKEQQEAAKKITKRNLRRPKTKQRLAEAFARSSKTPEKEQNETVENQSSVNQDKSNLSEDSNTSSEVIVDSPTVASPDTTKSGRHLLLRSMRKNNADKQAISASKKRKVLHIDIQTPLRNGRKRLLRKNAIKPQSPDGNSPPRKYTCLDTSSTLRQIRKTAENSQAASSTGKSTPVTSQELQPGKSRSAAKMVVANKILASTISNSPHYQRRKRISLDLNDSQTKSQTPKRLQREKPVHSVSQKSSTSNDPITEPIRRTRSATLASAGIATRTRRKL